MKHFILGFLLGLFLMFSLQVQALPGYGYEIDRIVSLLGKIETNTRKTP